MIEASKATEYLTSMIKGFKLEVSDAVDVVSKLTAVDMKAAVSAADIGAALQNVATTAQLAGVSLDETIAYASTIIETTQRDASSVGMALRTIMSRYGNVKAGAYTKMNLEASSDTDLENLNDIEKVLGKIGISIRSTNTEFRSFSDVLEELSDRWINLDNVSKNAIATAMAGVRQREQFLVLMENMDRAEELEEVSAHSQGTAESKYAAYMETIQSASNRLQSAWENLAITLEQSGLVKLFTDLSVVLMKILLPSIRAVGTVLIQYNAFKVPLWMKEFFSVGKGRSFVNGLGPAKFAQYQQDWKASKLEDIQKKQTEEANKKLAQSATSAASALDQVTESASQGAAAEAQGTKEENKNTNATVRDTEETQKHAKAVAQDTNQQKTGGVPGKTEKAKNRFKSVKSNLPGAALGGLFSGITTGVGTEGSTEAKVVSGAVAGSLTAVGGALAGPIGSIIGSAAGSLLAPKIAEWVDKEEIERKERVETASKQLTALKAQTKNLQAIVSYSKQDSLTSEDITTIKDYVAEIRDNVAVGDSVTFRTNLEGLIDTQLLTSLGYTQFEDLYRNLEDVLTDEKLSQEDKQKLAEAMNVANIQAERDAYYRSMEEKRHSGMSYDERLAYEKRLQKYDIEAAYYKSGIENLSTQALGEMGIEGAAKQVAAKLYGIDSSTDEGKKQLENLVVSNDLLRQITSLMKHSQSNSVQNLMAGQVYTLKDVVNNTFRLDSDVREEQLKKFANALGISVDNVINSVDAFGTLTLGDLNSSFADLKEATDALISRFDKLSTEGSLDLEDYLNIVTSNTGEAAIMGLGEEFNYAERIQQVAKVQGDYVQEKWLGHSDPWKYFMQDEIWGPDGFDENKSANGVFRGDRSYKDAYESIEQRLAQIEDESKVPGADIEALQTEYDNLVNIYNKMIKYQTNAANKVKEATADYAKQILLGSIQSHLEHRLEREIGALNEQKSALEQINTQREYENKLIEAKIKLENAQNEKKKVWREGVGWVYEADTSAIADAQKALEDLDNTKKVNELQAQIEELQAQKSWFSDFLDDRKFKKAEEFMSSWQTNIKNTVDMIGKWEDEWNTPNKQDVEDTKKQQKEKADLAHESARDQLAKAHDELVNTDAYKLIQSEKAAGKSDEEIRHSLSGLGASQREQWKSARNNYESALGADRVTADDIAGGEGSVTDPNTSENVKTFGDITPGYGRKARVNLAFNENDKIVFKGVAVQVTSQTLDPQQFADTKKKKRAKQLSFMNSKGKWSNCYFSGYKSIGDIQQKLTNRLVQDATTGQLMYIGDDHQIYAVKTTSIQNDEYTKKDGLGWYATGTLSTAGGLSMVNDDPQYGLEGIITPQGTLTALPSKSGVVPADLTRNVWQLGEVAPNLIKQLVDINGKFSHTTGFGTDESFNVEHLDVHMVAQPGFDMDDFVRQLQAARNLTRHS